MGRFEELKAWWDEVAKEAVPKWESEELPDGGVRLTSQVLSMPGPRTLRGAFLKGEGGKEVKVSSLEVCGGRCVICGQGGSLKQMIVARRATISLFVISFCSEDCVQKGKEATEVLRSIL